MVHKQVQCNKLLHNPPHRYTSPQHYPNINKGMATPHSSSEDVAEQGDKEEVSEVDKEDVDGVREQPKFPCLPCHMWEATSLYLTFQVANNNLQCTPIKRSTSATKMYATHVDSTSKIGTRAQLAPTRNKGIRTDSQVRTTRGTNKRGIPFPRKRCARRFTRWPDGVGQWR